MLDTNARKQRNVKKYDIIPVNALPDFAKNTTPEQFKNALKKLGLKPFQLSRFVENSILNPKELNIDNLEEFFDVILKRLSHEDERAMMINFAGLFGGLALTASGLGILGAAITALSSGSFVFLADKMENVKKILPRKEMFISYGDELNRIKEDIYEKLQSENGLDQIIEEVNNAKNHDGKWQNFFKYRLLRHKVRDSDPIFIIELAAASVYSELLDAHLRHDTEIALRAAEIAYNSNEEISDIFTRMDEQGIIATATVLNTLIALKSSDPKLPKHVDKLDQDYLELFDGFDLDMLTKMRNSLAKAAKEKKNTPSQNLTKPQRKILKKISKKRTIRGFNNG